MTALDEFERLEAPGLYTPRAGAQRVDVILSLGDATLTITDQRDRVLSHWSLAAIERVNPGQTPALYAPGPDTGEQVEIADDLMVHSIERIRRAIHRARPRPGRLRRRLRLAAGALVLAVVLFWLPGALIATTSRIVPEAARADIGARLLDEIAVIAGRPCAEPEGRQALDALLRRLGADGPGRAHVLPGAPEGARHLPGGIVLLSRGVVEDHETAEVAAGYLLAETARIKERDPLLRLLNQAGLLDTARLITTGRLPDAAIKAHAEALMLAEPDPVDTDALAARFRRAGVPMAPYAYALDITGETTLPLIEADPFATGGARPVLTDNAWVALQGICG